jgi:hypothetical protein
MVAEPRSPVDSLNADADNARRPEPYTHLLPSLIPQSINI